MNPDITLTDQATDTSFTHAFLDLDDDGINDFTFSALSSVQGGGGQGTFNLAGAKPYSAGGLNIHTNGIAGYNHGILFYPSAFSQGALIGPSQNFWTQVNRVGTLVWDYLNGAKYGQWKNDVIDKYMGVHFKTGDGNFHFGWVRMDVFQDPVQITVKDFAYQLAPDTSIHAGDMGNIGVPAVNGNGNIKMFAFEKEVFISSSNMPGDQMTVTVKDILGKTVLNKTTEGSALRLSLKDLPGSTYLVTANKGNEVKTIKVSIR